MSKTHQALADERNETVLIYVNGDLLARSDAKISVFDSAFLVGDGVWEGIRLHNGSLAFLDRHLDRLYAGAAAIDLDIGLTRLELTNEIEKTLAANQMTTDVHIRLMISRGNKKTPSQHPDLIVGGPNIVIIAEHKAADPSITQAGIDLFTSTVRRPGPEILDQRLNCHSKLHEVIALIQAYKAGADEALMLDPTGHVATCNSTNFFIVTKGEVWTSTGEYCLNGITRGLVIELCEAEGITSFAKPFSLTDVYAADEAFVTGTFGALTPVNHVDGRRIGDSSHPITDQLSAAYSDLVHSL